MNKVRTDESVYWDRYSDALYDVTSQLDSMRKRISWICDRADGFKRQTGSERREELVKSVRDELSDVCNVAYRDALDIIAKLDAMVGMEIEAEGIIKRMEENNDES